MARGRILVTGATGMLGAATVEHLHEYEIVAVTRNGVDDGDGARATGASGLVRASANHRLLERSLAHDDVRHVRADVTQPLLGLPEEEYSALARELDAVVHCAGVTDFTTHRRVTDALNVGGALQAADLARRAGCRLFHVSTAYVRTADGAETIGGKWGAGIYLRSKIESERVVREAGVPATILRPTIAVGDSRTGWTPTYQGLHRLIAGIVGESMPLIPVPEHAHIDFLPRDVLGRELARAVRDGVEDDVWIAAGEAAPRLGRIIELTCAAALRRGREVAPPRLVEREIVDRLLRPAFEDEIGRKIDLMVALTAHFDQSGGTLPTSLEISTAELEQAWVRSVEFWAERNLDGAREEVAAG